MLLLLLENGQFVFYPTPKGREVHRHVYSLLLIVESDSDTFSHVLKFFNLVLTRN